MFVWCVFAFFVMSIVLIIGYLNVHFLIIEKLVSDVGVSVSTGHSRLIKVVLASVIVV